jgi:hypothetical protein
VVLDLVLRGATVVTPGHAEAADIGIAGGRIAQLGGTMSGTRELAAGGLLAIPGGIAGYSVYDGWQVQGWPRFVLRRGHLVLADGELTTRHQHRPMAPPQPSRSVISDLRSPRILCRGAMSLGCGPSRSKHPGRGADGARDAPDRIPAPAGKPANHHDGAP